MNSPEQNVHLKWHGPVSLVPVAGVTCFTEDHIANNAYGMYLWTLPYKESHLINYVGKVYGGISNRTFARRFGEELDYERSRGLCVDVELFLKGVRSKVQWHKNDVERVLSAYRVFIAPLNDLGDEAFLAIEASLINALHDAGHRYSSFVANPRRIKQYAGSITMEFPTSLLGLDSFSTLPASERVPELVPPRTEPVTSKSKPTSTPTTAQARKVMAELVLKRARKNESNFGDWLWGNYVEEFSSDCGIHIPKPEGEGKRDGRNSYRLAFASYIREVIPIDEYHYSILVERIDQVVNAILRFHGRM